MRFEAEIVGSISGQGRVASYKVWGLTTASSLLDSVVTTEFESASASAWDVTVALSGGNIQISVLPDATAETHYTMRFKYINVTNG